MFFILGSKNVKDILMSQLQKKRFRDTIKASHLSQKSLLRVYVYQIGMGMSAFIFCFKPLGRLCLYIHSNDVLSRNKFSSKFRKIYK